MDLETIDINRPANAVSKNCQTRNSVFSWQRSGPKRIILLTGDVGSGRPRRSSCACENISLSIQPNACSIPHPRQLEKRRNVYPSRPQPRWLRPYHRRSRRRSDRCDVPLDDRQISLIGCAERQSRWNQELTTGGEDVTLGSGGRRSGSLGISHRSGGSIHTAAERPS